MNNKTPDSRDILRRLLLIAAVAVGVMVYAYGWSATEIGLEETQDPTRQESVTRALRELLSPDIFDQDRESLFADASIQFGCDADSAPEQVAPVEGEPYVVLKPACGMPGDLIEIEGHNFPASADAFIRWIPPEGQSRPLVRTDIDDSGFFDTVIEVPRIRGSEGEVHLLEAEGSWPTGLPYFSDTTKTVVEKMIETIFLALMATTIAVPISVVLSFLSARNLMRQVHLPLGNVLVGFVLLPVGWVLGKALLSPIGTLGATWGQELWLGLIGLVVSIALYVGAARVLGGMQLELGTAAYKLRKIAMNVVLLVVGIFVVGAVGGLGIWLGVRLEVGLLSDLGNFVGTLGRLVELMISFVGGIAAAFLVSSVGMDLTRDWLKYVKDGASHVAGALLGALGGAFLMAIFAMIANSAAFLGLLTPIVAAVLGMQIVIIVYNRLTGKGGHGDDEWDQSIRMAVAGLAAVLLFFLTYTYLNMNRGIVDGRVPATYEWNLGFVSVQAFLGKAMLVGAVLGGIGGALAGTHAAFPLGMTIYNTARTILNALRSIEPLIMGIVFVIWVGVGPFAGVLALTLHSIAALGKLYSEQTENIDVGPLEAIQATGANRIQTIIYGVIPQIVPPYIAFTMYRWDINVRMSTIIGFVGGGGIGFLLQQQINLLRYRDAGVAVLAIAIVVSVLDYLSATIRERIV